MDIKLETELTIKFSVVQNFEDYEECNRGATTNDLAASVQAQAREYIDQMLGRADNVLPSNWTYEVKQSEYWRQ